ncbi:GL24838 [Drosophila persimilis]|uniref:GL24838 n=1 Tax=Drosophila persimilis TaxID=7234 RepID=B4GRZ4_DROPE|nr:GL24838 [Drosophila persimilis]
MNEVSQRHLIVALIERSDKNMTMTATQWKLGDRALKQLQLQNKDQRGGLPACGLLPPKGRKCGHMSH